MCLENGEAERIAPSATTTPFYGTTFYGTPLIASRFPSPILMGCSRAAHALDRDTIRPHAVLFNRVLTTPETALQSQGANFNTSRERLPCRIAPARGTRQPSGSQDHSCKPPAFAVRRLTNRISQALRLSGSQADHSRQGGNMISLVFRLCNLILRLCNRVALEFHFMLGCDTVTCT